MHSSTRKFVEAAAARGIEIQVVEHQESTRSAQEAAEAIGCEVAQIVKSLCFTVAEQPVIALLSGVNQLSVAKLSQLRGVGKRQVRRANADDVKAATGYSIGGVPPFGHLTPLPIYVDQDLTAFDVVWAAAGTPNAVFAISPQSLTAACGGQLADLKQQPT